MLEKRTVSQCISSDYCKGWNDAVDEMPKWIDVNERLPDEEGDYLCVMADDIIDPFVIIKRFVNGGFHVTEWYEEYVGRRVTHWMPLPEPPEAGVDNG